MVRRLRLIILSITICLAPLPTAELPADPLPAICAPNHHLRSPALCPDTGPARYANHIISAGRPYPLPPALITPIAPSHMLAPAPYMRVITDTPAVYNHPLTMLAGWPPVRAWEKGFVFVSVMGQATIEGLDFYQINAGEFMRADDLQAVRPSRFQGRHFDTPPNLPVGWVITRAQVSLAAGQAPATDAPYAGRYQPVEVYNTQLVGEWHWYQIGPDQWVEQRNVALVQPTPPPGAGGAVIAVDVYEQTLGVYRNGGLIFATLVSSGSRYFPTRTGVFKVWAKIGQRKMSGAYLADRRDYYYLEDVPWILFYDGQRALHGTYWHDNFGFRSSHGCVNLSLTDAHWLFDYASVGSTVIVFDSQPPPVR